MIPRKSQIMAVLRGLVDEGPFYVVDWRDGMPADERSEDNTYTGKVGLVANEVSTEWGDTDRRTNSRTVDHTSWNVFLEFKACEIDAHAFEAKLASAAGVVIPGDETSAGGRLLLRSADYSHPIQGNSSDGTRITYKFDFKPTRS